MGAVYILSNKHYLNGKLLKIGMTTRSVHKRVSEINQPFGVPPKFDVVFEMDTDSPNLAEKIIHKKLKRYRVNRRKEFFLLTKRDAVKTVKNVCGMLTEDQYYKPPLYQVITLLIMTCLIFIW